MLLLLPLFLVGALILAQLGSTQVVPIGDVTWFLPATHAALGQCQPIEIKFLSPSRPFDVGVNFYFNDTARWTALRNWTEGAPYWMDGSTEIDVKVAVFDFPAGVLVWFTVDDGQSKISFLAGSGFMVQPSSDDRCLPIDPRSPHHIYMSASTSRGIMTGQGIFTTVFPSSPTSPLSSPTATSPTPSPPSPPSPGVAQGETASNTAAIAGGVVGAVGALGLTVVAGAFVWRRRKARQGQGLGALSEKPPEETDIASAPIAAPFVAPYSYTSPSQPTPTLAATDYVQELDAADAERVPPVYWDRTSGLAIPSPVSATSEGAAGKPSMSPPQTRDASSTGRGTQ